MDANNIWSLDYLNSLIENKVQESLNLEYKSAEALDEKHRNEITKDVSSFANSDGGIIIYGIKEFNDKDKKHLPEKIDPINPSLFSRERLEQIINLIRPKIEGLIIIPIDLDENMVAYIVEIPKGNTAHQANDKRYYKRYNFISTPMEDYEIRDINNRLTHPKIELELQIITTITEFRDHMLGGFSSFNLQTIPSKKDTSTKLKIYANNIGSVYVNYVSAKLYIPSNLLLFDKDIEKVTVLNVKNKFRDVTEYQSTGMSVMPKSYAASRFEPILPGNYLFLKDESIVNDVNSFHQQEIKWEVNADNAPVQKGSIKIFDILHKIEDNTNK
jgi:hypothetical protein